MSREIRRLHRAKTSFTNFQSDEVNETDTTDIRTRRRRHRRRDINDSVESSVETTQSQLEVEEFAQSDSQPRRRRRRRESDDHVESVVETTQSQQEIESVIEPAAFPTVSLSNDISAIRAEFQEDTYHRELSSSDFADDVHDWEGDSDLCSDEYWSFVGSYE